MLSERSKLSKTDRQIAVAVLVSVVFLWAFAGSAGDLVTALQGLPYLLDYLQGMWPPDWCVLPELVEPLGETLQSAIVGVSLAAAISVPFSFLAARNTSPLVVYWVSRSIIAVLRGLPTLLWAIMFVSMVGLGPLAGVFAITCHCVGTFGKLFSEAIESVGPRVRETMEAMSIDGATTRQIIAYGLFPEVWPFFVNFIAYYFEWGVRVGTILGLVGAGGIGLRLTMSIRLFKRQETSAIILVILAMVISIDQFSRRVREKLLEDW